MKGVTEKLGNLLVKSEEWIELDPSQEYKEVTVRLWGKGVTLRRIATGSQIGSSRRLRVEPQQFIFSRIDARNGAFGLIPDELSGAVVSNDFPSFTPKSNKLLPKYLGWLSKTHQFVNACRVASEGTTNRKRLREEKFYEIEIPLPSLPEQKRIVAKIEKLATELEKATNIRNHSMSKLDIMFGNVLKKTFCPHNSYTPLGEVITLKRGYDLPKQDRISGPYPVFAANSIVGYHYEAKVKGPGVVTGRSGSVGAVNFIEGDFWPLNTALYVRDFKGNKPKIVYYLLLAVSDKLKEVGSHTAVPTLDRKRAHKEIFVSIPSNNEQNRVVTYIDRLQAKVANLKTLQEETTTELNALLPSILDKAFKGDL